MYPESHQTNRSPTVRSAAGNQRTLLSDIEGPAAIFSNPPCKHLPAALRLKMSLLLQFFEARESSLVRESNLVGNLAGKEEGIFSPLEKAKNLAIVHSFLSSSRHWVCLYSPDTYYHTIIVRLYSTGLLLLDNSLYIVSLLQTTKCYRWNNSSDCRVAMASAECDAGDGTPTPLGVSTVMQAKTSRGLETPATTAEPPPTRRRDLSHADALQLCQEVEGVGARVTASDSSEITPERVTSRIHETIES